MFKLKQKNKLPIGLDLGHGSIKMIQMQMDEDSLSIRAADRVVIDPNLEDDQRRDYILKTIRNMVERGSFKGRDVVASISNKDIRLKNLRVDSIADEDLKILIHEEVAEQLHLDPDIDEIRYMVAGKVHHSGELKNEVIFMGTDKSTIGSYIDLLTEAGVTPIAIDSVPHALQRSFTRSLRRQSDQVQVNFYIDIGSMFTTVVIGSNQQIHFIKYIPIAGDNLNREVASRLGVSVEEAVILRSKNQHDSGKSDSLATRRAVTDAMASIVEELTNEISLCFRYYAVTFRGRRPGHAIIAGGEAYETTLRDLLKKELDLEMEIAMPLKGLDLSRMGKIVDHESPLCEWSVATGLSIRGCSLIQHEQENHERN